LNGQSFYLIWNKRSWIAEVEGKKYYLLNLPEEEMATKAIARVLRYGAKIGKEEGATEEGGADVEGAEEIPTPEPESTEEV